MASSSSRYPRRVESYDDLVKRERLLTKGIKSSQARLARITAKREKHPDATWRMLDKQLPAFLYDIFTADDPRQGALTRLEIVDELQEQEDGSVHDFFRVRLTYSRLSDSFVYEAAGFSHSREQVHWQSHPEFAPFVGDEDGDYAVPISPAGWRAALGRNHEHRELALVALIRVALNMWAIPPESADIIPFILRRVADYQTIGASLRATGRVSFDDLQHALQILGTQNNVDAQEQLGFKLPEMKEACQQRRGLPSTWSQMQRWITEDRAARRKLTDEMSAIVEAEEKKKKKEETDKRLVVQKTTATTKKKKKKAPSKAANVAATMGVKRAGDYFYASFDSSSSSSSSSDDEAPPPKKQRRE